MAARLKKNRALTLTAHLAPGLKAFLAALEPVRAGSDIVTVGNHPNPFNPETVVRVELDSDFFSGSDRLTVRVYDVRGALVRELYAGRPTASELRVRWDGRDRNGSEVASSIYFAVARAGNSLVTRKLILIR